MVLEDAFESVNKEYQWAVGHFEPFHSAHEGLAIIQEEYEELKEEVFKSLSMRDMSMMQKEARHLAAMTLRFLIEVC